MTRLKPKRVHSKHIFSKPASERAYHRAPAKRDRLIHALRKKGLGVQEIGRRLGISHQRVCQILKKKPPA